MVLSIVICTRNREDDLRRCFQSIVDSEKPSQVDGIEVFVIDDGALSEDFLRIESDPFRSRGFQWSYFRKDKNRGLFFSRMHGLREAKGDVICFLDDDSEISSSYLKQSVMHFSKNPNLVGLSGVDEKTARPSLSWLLWARLFQYHSGEAGRLSKSGFGGAMHDWADRSEPFRTDFLTGCNMTFRKEALLDLAEQSDVRWFRSYSLGEDLFLSGWARKKGELWVDPSMKVKHHQSPVARDRLEEVAFWNIYSHHQILEEFEKDFDSFSKMAFYWTSLGLVVRGLLKKERKSLLKGYLRGLGATLSGHSLSGSTE